MRKGEVMPDWLKEKIRQSNIGRKRTAETRKRMSEARKGIPPNKNNREATKKAMTGNKFALGRKDTPEQLEKKKIVFNTPEHKEYASKRAKKMWADPSFVEARKKFLKDWWDNKENRDSRSGENSHFYKGGLTNRVYPTEFGPALKEEIRRRDDYICQMPDCEGHGLSRKLCIHHIDYDKTNNDKSNLISLCSKCHAKTTLGDREYYTMLFQELQSIRGLGSTGNVEKSWQTYSFSNNITGLGSAGI